jgi:outer membrane lipoprotein SlyB
MGILDIIRGLQFANPFTGPGAYSRVAGALNPNEEELDPYNPDTPPALPPAAPSTPPAVRPYSAPPALPMPRERQSRYGELEEARDVYKQGAPGRKKSLLLGALRGGLQGLASGGGLAGGLGGAIAGGAAGGISPQGLREQEFNERILPKIQERFRMEDLDAAMNRQADLDQQNAALNQVKIGQLESETDLNRARANGVRFPRPERQPLVNTGRGVYDPVAKQIIPGTAPPEKQPAPHNVFTQERGLVDVNQLTPEERAKLHPYQRPRAPKAAKAEKKYASETDVLAAAEKAGVTASQMRAKFKEQGYTVVR